MPIECLLVLSHQMATEDGWIEVMRSIPLFLPRFRALETHFTSSKKKLACYHLKQLINVCWWLVEMNFTRWLRRPKTARISFPKRNKRNRTYPYLVLCCFLSFRRLVLPWKDKTLRRTISNKIEPQHIRRHTQGTHAYGVLRHWESVHQKMA